MKYHNAINMEKITASIITIGDELLIGQVVDTNSPWMAQELNKIGVWLHHRVAVGDVKDEIIEALDNEFKRSHIILITGGLGPTKDDITKEVLNEYFGGKLKVNEAALANIKNIFENILKKPMIESNLQQAIVPDVCTVIENKRGTAPGMWFEKEGKIFVSMPGVPFEMKAMMTDYVLPMLSKRFTMPYIGHRTMLTAGIGESYLAERIKEWENNLPSNIKLAYLPNLGMVRLRITSIGKNKTEIETQLDSAFEQLKKIIPDVMVADEDITMETLLGHILNERKKTVATAESCTGGYIAHLMTANPKSSSFFTGSIVCYDTKIKSDVLNVDKALLEKEGAVSENVAKQLVEGTLKLMGSAYAIAVTGLMGPDAGDENKPVGTVWIGVGDNSKIETQEFFFRYDRKRNIQLTAVNAMNMLRKFILQNH